jgi:hypothetical protein
MFLRTLQLIYYTIYNVTYHRISTRAIMAISTSMMHLVTSSKFTKEREKDNGETCPPHPSFLKNKNNNNNNHDHQRRSVAVPAHVELRALSIRGIRRSVPPALPGEDFGPCRGLSICHVIMSVTYNPPPPKSLPPYRGPSHRSPPASYTIGNFTGNERACEASRFSHVVDVFQQQMRPVHIFVALERLDLEWTLSPL